MRVLVAMSGGVDSSLAAARLAEAGDEVVGATLKLWGGRSDSGCCSATDAADARRVADQLGIEHHVFNYEERFNAGVVTPFIEAHGRGETPNPCVACNREVKFGALLARAERLGFDKLATGHHARLVLGAAGAELRRGADPRKDQSYVLAALGPDELARVLLPIGAMTKDEVRSEARRRGLRTAEKPDSQDLCFIGGEGGRRALLASRLELHRATVRDRVGAVLGEVEEMELLTLGQRRGLGLSSGTRRFVVGLDIPRREVTLGSAEELLTGSLALTDRTWTGEALAPGSAVGVQVAAHGAPRPAVLTTAGVAFGRPERLVAPGQLAALYLGDLVVGSGVVAAPELAASEMVGR